MAKETLKERVEQFHQLRLPGQMPVMHMGTSYLMDDLWNTVQAREAAMVEAVRVLTKMHGRVYSVDRFKYEMAILRNTLVGVLHPELSIADGVIAVMGTGEGIKDGEDLAQQVATQLAAAQVDLDPAISAALDDGLFEKLREDQITKEVEQGLTVVNNILTLEEKSCAWEQDEDGAWGTGCGHVFEFTNDGPAENGAAYCMFCGGKLVAVPHVEQQSVSEWKGWFGQGSAHSPDQIVALAALDVVALCLAIRSAAQTLALRGMGDGAFHAAQCAEAKAKGDLNVLLEGWTE